MNHQDNVTILSNGHDDPANDSEAETEILGSHTNTPVKQQPKMLHDVRGSTAAEDRDCTASGTSSSPDVKMSNGASRGREVQHGSHAGEKRKAQDDLNREATNGHERRIRSHGGSPVPKMKKMRLSPDRHPRTGPGQGHDVETKGRATGLGISHNGISKERSRSRTGADHDLKQEQGLAETHDPSTTALSTRVGRQSPDQALVDGDAARSPESFSRQSPSSPPPSTARNPRAVMGSKRPSRLHHPNPPQRISADIPAYIATISNRATTHEPRTRSASPQVSHKRSSSFQTCASLPNYDPDRRLRVRPAASTPTLSSLSLGESSEHRQHTPVDSPNSIITHMPPRTRLEKDGTTPLARACEDGRLAEARKLIEEFPEDLERGDYSQNRPLQKAAIRGRVEIVKLLIGAGCSVNIHNDPERSNADTPLIDAIEAGFPDVVKCLLDAGASPWKKNAMFRMPSDCLEEAEGISDEDRAEIRALLDQSMKKHLADPNDACQHDYQPTKLAQTDKSKLNAVYNVTEMEARIEHGDLRRVSEMIGIKIKPNQKCALAAARVGVSEIFEKVFGQHTGAHLEIDPISRNGEDDTPILAAIGRGNLGVLRYILDSRGFDPLRQVDGQTYSRIASERMGPRMHEEIRMLDQASRRASASHDATEKDVNLGMTDAALAPTSKNLSPPELRRSSNSSPLKRKRLMRRDEMPEEARLKKDQDERREEAAEKARVKLEEEAEKARVERAAFLGSLPVALAEALRPEGKIPSSSAQLPVEERDWKITLKDWLPLPVYRRYEVDPLHPPDLRDQRFILNIHATVFCRYDKLTTCGKNPRSVTLPATRGQREDHERCSSIAADLAMTHQWALAPLHEVKKASVPFTDLGDGQFSILPMSLVLDSRRKFLDMPDEQFFFVDLASFIESTRDMPWLRDLDITTTDMVAAQDGPVYRNGEYIGEFSREMSCGLQGMMPEGAARMYD